MASEGIRLPTIQRQLGHAHLGITSIDLQGVDTLEIVDTAHHRRQPSQRRPAAITTEERARDECIARPGDQLDSHHRAAEKPRMGPKAVTVVVPTNTGMWLGWSKKSGTVRLLIPRIGLAARPWPGVASRR
jgi:hypothetical protein